MANDTTTPADVTAVDDDALTGEHNELMERINALRPKVADRSLTPDELTQLQTDTQRFGTVNAEVQARQERRDAAYGALDEGLAAVPDPAAEPAPDPATETTVEPATGTPDAAPSTEGAGETAPADTASSTADTVPSIAPAGADTSPEQPATGTTTQGQETPVAASATNPPLGSVTQAARDTTQPARDVPRAAIAITASADVQGFAAGQPMQLEDLGTAMARRAQGVMAGNPRRRRGGGGMSSDGEQVYVATLTASGVPEDRILRKGSLAENTRKLQAVTSRRAITAAGGHCHPFEIDYSQSILGSRGRPLHDALPSFQAERGGLQARRAVSPATNKAEDGPRSATDHWTAEDDAEADSPSSTKRKGYWVVDCDEFETWSVEAITLQVELPNWGKFDPEGMQVSAEAALIWHDRHCENWLWARLADSCKLMTHEKVLGATRDLLTTLDQLQAYTRSVHRLSDDIPLEVPMQTWMRSMIRADMTRAMSFSTDTLNITNAMIDAWLASRGLSPVWMLDGDDEDQALGATAASGNTPAVPGVPVAAQQYSMLEDKPGGVPVPAFPAQVDLLMYPIGHFQHLDGGTLDLGIVRDSELIERNRYRQFSETWEGVADRGVEAIRLVADVIPDGGMSGTVPPEDVAANPAVIGA